MPFNFDAEISLYNILYCSYSLPHFFCLFVLFFKDLAISYKYRPINYKNYLYKERL